MYLIRVVALSLGAPSQELSYFYKEELPLGACIKITLRGKDSFALVVGVEQAAEAKQALKGTSFALQKLASPGPSVLLSRTVLRALFTAAQYEACAPGALIGSLIPAAILKRRTSLAYTLEKEHGEEDAHVQGGAAYEPLLYAAPRAERVSEYRRIAREGLARGSSLVIVVPTVAEADDLVRTLSRGIEGYVEALHSGLSEKKLADAWTRIATSKKSVLIIGTLSALLAPRHDIKTIILEREGSHSYARTLRPYVQGKRVAEEVARALGTRFILAGTVSSVETAARKRARDIGDYSVSMVRLSGQKPLLIDMREHKKTRLGYDPLSPHTHEEIAGLLAAQKSVFVLASRRGLAPLTICDDCGTQLTCRNCSSHLVLHEQKGKRLYICHHCGQEESASIRCAHCSGWRLTTLGVSIETTAQSLRVNHPEAQLTVTSKDTGTTREIERSILRWKKEGGILAATELALPYLPETIPGIAVASVDSMLGIPEYSASERAFTLLCEMRSRAEDVFILQTRAPEHRVVKALLEGVSAGFYKDELADREKYGYPPYRTLIRLSVSGTATVAESLAKEIAKALEQFSPALFEGRSVRAGRRRFHILLRLPSGTWPDQRLLRFMRLLPPQVEVRIDPYTLLSD